MPEDKRARFVRLAERRVNAAIKAVRLIGNLSNKTIYGYTEDDVTRIFRVLEKELKSAKSRYENGSKGAEPIFRLE